METSPPNFVDWRRMSRSFTAMGAFQGLPRNLVGGTEPRRLEGATVDANVLRMLGVPPRLGRIFTDEDDRPGAPATVVLSYALWRSEFGGRTDVLGTRLRLDETEHLVIGVMPPAFMFPTRERPDVDAAPARPGRGHGSRQQLSARPGQARAGDVARGGAGGDEHRDRAARARLPERKSPNPRDGALAAGPGAGAEPPDARGARRRLALRPAHRLHEPREPAPHARPQAAEGAGDADGAGRGARATRAPNADREPRALRRWADCSASRSPSSPFPCSRGWCRRRSPWPRPPRSTHACSIFAAIATLPRASGSASCPRFASRAIAIFPACAKVRGAVPADAPSGCAPSSSSAEVPRRSSSSSRRACSFARCGASRPSTRASNRRASSPSRRRCHRQIRGDGPPRRLVFADPAGCARAARRHERRVHQFSPDGDARRHLARRGRRASTDPRGPGDQRAASLRYVTPGFFSTLQIPLGRGATSASPTRRNARVAVVSQSFARRYCPGRIRSDSGSRSPSWSEQLWASSAISAFEGSNARASRRSTCRTSRSPTATSASTSRRSSSFDRRPSRHAATGRPRHHSQGGPGHAYLAARTLQEVVDADTASRSRSFGC